MEEPKAAHAHASGGVGFLLYTEVRPVQSEKASLQIFVTLLGMVTDVSQTQSPKATAPIYVTLLGIETEVRPVHP